MMSRWRRRNAADLYSYFKGSLKIRSLVVWLVLGAIYWLDHPVAGVQRAEFFSWLVPILTSVGKGVGNVVATYLVDGVRGALSALGGAVRWVIGQLKSFVVSTGAMFAKVWRSLEGFYKNVIRQALFKLHDWYVRLRAWLTRIFKPLIAFIDKIRDHIHEIYRRFVRPVLDALDTARKVLSILAKLHVPFAKQLDTYLAKTEQWIVDRYNQLNADLNKVRDTINGILTLDGFLQRFLFLRTIERDVFYVWRALANAGTRPVTAEQHQRIKHLTLLPDDADLRAQFTAYWKGEPSTVGEWADASVADATSEWTTTA